MFTLCPGQFTFSFWFIPGVCLFCFFGARRCFRSSAPRVSLQIWRLKHASKHVVKIRNIFENAEYLGRQGGSRVSRALICAWWIRVIADSCYANPSCDQIRDRALLRRHRDPRKEFLVRQGRHQELAAMLGEGARRFRRCADGDKRAKCKGSDC